LSYIEVHDSQTSVSSSAPERGEQKRNKKVIILSDEPLTPRLYTAAVLFFLAAADERGER